MSNLDRGQLGRDAQNLERRARAAEYLGLNELGAQLRQLARSAGERAISPTDDLRLVPAVAPDPSCDQVPTGRANSEVEIVLSKSMHAAG